MASQETTVLRDHTYRACHRLAMLRALHGDFIINGQEPAISQRGAGANMSVDVGAFKYVLNGTFGEKLTTTNVAIDASDATNPRIDLIYLATGGTITVLKGTAKAVKPTGETTWQKYEEPYPADLSGTAGIVLAEVLVPAGATTIVDAYIRNVVVSEALALYYASEARGDLLARGASVWGRLALGTAGLPLVAGATDPGYAALDKRGMRGAALGEIPTTRALDKDLAGRLHLVYPTDEAIELQAGMECVGDADGNSKPLYFRASSDDDSTIRSATNKTWRVEIEYLDGAGGGSGSITGATAASPCVITSNGHGLENGQYVFISGIVGIYGVNGKLWKVANKAANTFQLEGSTSTGTYSSGGTWYKGCIVAEMTNATPAAVIAPLVVLRNTGIWKTARTTADLTARCNADYSGQGNADLKLSGDISGLDLYIRAVRLYNPTTKAQITWTAGGVLQSPISPALMSQDAAGGLAYTSHMYASDVNITSTNYVEVDSTNLALSFESRGGVVLIGVGLGIKPASALYVDIQVDGNYVGGAPDNELLSDKNTAEHFISFVVPVALSPGPHRISVWACVDSGTSTVVNDVLNYIWAKECF